MAFPALIAGRYEIKDSLGEGGMGVVYRAVDIKTKSYVALKTMRDVSDPAAVELFSKEWSVLAGLSHPNIVDIRDVGELDDGGEKKPFFVMPLLPGATLAKLIETSSTRLTIDRVVAIVTQVSRGLQAAHEQSLVHRDIKPSNIFVMEDDTAKIIDFGVVHLAGVHSETGQKGTWQYMAPEQIDMKAATPVSDIFSLGVVCYEALTGRKPFARKTPAETADAVRTHIPPPICDINPSVSQLLSMVIHKAMAKQPMHRFSSARDFCDTLQKAVLNQPISRFDLAKIRSRIERAKNAFHQGDIDFASEILTELETEGHIDPEIRVLRLKIEQTARQRKIRQLLEVARTRVEQDEIPLALEKLHEVLEVDPENSDARSMLKALDKQMTELQVESWMSLAKQHIEQHDFPAARLALDELLKLRPSYRVALDLLREIDRLEAEARRIRSEKESLYDSAIKAYNNGEITTALSKMERLLDIGRGTPEAASPDRDAVYQSFYKEVRSQCDAIHNAYEEARRNLAEKNFRRTIEICDDFIGRYPSNPVFQALKLETVEQQRQELAAYIAEIGRRAEAEPDLDRKVNLYKEACERYPTEQQFQQSLKLTRERRDLVLGIVAKARYYEEKILFAEAIGQWEIVRSIYPRYPGIEVEIEQLQKRKDQQLKEDSKSRLINQVDSLLDLGEFARARELALSGLQEYDQDQELVALERLARQGLERSSEARELCGAGDALCAHGQFLEASENFRRALDLDPKNRGIRERLVKALLEQARALIETDWRAAEPFVQQAAEIEPAHPDVRGLRTQIADLKRKEFVPQCLAEARELQAVGDLKGALNKIDSGLVQYPNEARLLELKTRLESLLRETRRSKTRADDIGALHDLKQRAARSSTVAQLGSIFEQSQTIQRNHPDDPEVGALAAEIQQAAGATAAILGGDASVFAPPTATVPLPVKGGSGAVAVPARTPPPPAPIKKAGVGEGLAGGVQPLLLWLRAAAAPVWAFFRQPVIAGRGVSRLVIVGVTVLLVLAAAVAYYLRPRRTPPGPMQLVDVHVQTTPADAAIIVSEAAKDGVISPTSGRTYELDPTKTYEVTVSKDGYITAARVPKRPDESWSFVLTPRPVRLNLATDEKSGSIFIDDSSRGDLQIGQVPDVEITPDTNSTHTLALRNGRREILSLGFTAHPAEAPQVSNVKGLDLIVVSSFKNEAVVYAGSTTLTANLKNQEPQPIPPDGLKLSGITSTNNELTIVDKTGTREFPKVLIDAGDTPALYVGKNADVNVAYLQVDVTPETAKLFVNDHEERPLRPGRWVLSNRKPGSYKILAAADGYNDHQEPSRNLNKGWNTPLSIALTKKPTPVLQPLPPRLIITGGTSSAEIYTDGVRKGQLDSSGSATIEITPGTHTIRIQKQYCEPSEISRNFVAGQPIMLGPDEAKLKEWGTLVFQVTPAEAHVSYGRTPQNDHTGTAASHDSVRVPEGTYEIKAEAEGYYDSPDAKVTVHWGGQPVTVPIALSKRPIIVPKWVPEDPSRVKEAQNWTIGMPPPEYVFLKSGRFPLTLVFPDPGKRHIGPFTKQIHVHWVVGYFSETRKIDYDFEFGKDRLTQKASLPGKAIGDPSTTCPLHQGDNIQFSIAVESRRIEVSSPACKDPLIYTSDEEDFTKGKAGLRSGLYFSILQ
ncbi:MAG TPA: protein kinase [Bryobacteraceae bacterium]|nr:protein kinase [Bryobacteraceae bacterium]